MNKILVFVLLFFFISGTFVTTFSSVSAASKLVADSWNTKTPMTQEYTGVSFAVLDGKIYAIGGSNERYDPATDTWTTLKFIPTPRTNVNVVAYQGKIYCIGGIVSASGPGLYRSLNTVEVYDPVTDSWSSKASVPLDATYFWLEYYYPDMKVCVVNEHLFAIARSGELFMYNTSADSWSSKASLSVDEDWYPHVYVVDGQLFVITPSRAMYMYNPHVDLWTKKTNMPLSDSNYSLYPFVTVIDNKIVIGDHQKTDLSAGSVQLNLRIYDPKTDVWSERKTNSKSVILYGGSMFVGETSGAYAPKKFYIFGYEQVNQDSFQAFTWMYDPKSDVWSTAKATNTFRNVLASQLVVANDIFYLIGGSFNDQYVPVGYNPQGYHDTHPSATAPAVSDVTSSPVPSESSGSFLDSSAVVVATIITACVVVTALFFYLRGRTRTKRNHKYE
jgi:N-acetylneuraminic acid mutarotase